MRKLSVYLVLALLGGALLAACGSSASSTTTTTTTTTSSQTGGGSSASSAATGTGAAHPLSAKKQVEICTDNVRAISALTAAAKAKLQKSCEKAGASTRAQRRVVHEVCEALASRYPAGVIRERALAICRRAP